MDGLGETIATYDGDVERYVDKLEFPLPDKDLDYFIEFLDGDLVLDAGCGAGRDSKYFVDKGLDVIGIDLSVNMLEKAQKRTNAEFLVGDVRKTIFYSGAFSGVWCYNTLLHLDNDDFQSAISEFKRLLVPRGVLYIATRYGKGVDIKESSAGKKHFYLYDKTYIQGSLNHVGFEILHWKEYSQKDQLFIDFLARRL